MHPLSPETRRLLEEHLNEVDAETTAGQNAVKQVLGRPGDPNHEFYKKLLVAIPATLAEVDALRKRLTKENDHEAMLRDVWKASAETDADMRDGASATQDVSRGRAVVLRRISVVLVRRLKEEVPHDTYVRTFVSLAS
ncbi:hypothetical protein EJ065_1809 [Corallococcus coralloides]|uniref:Uncharacterized protein n=1 Tax=Corallococcus coralloides TaxID=184914 RepID=A0A410RN71_CORCK|nr:hypothetical protein [Corallococcus coralloides]QAT83407.1 hypothetical protein EJ065_1809 [Corallococcus coralloides]